MRQLLTQRLKNIYRNDLRWVQKNRTSILLILILIGLLIVFLSLFFRTKHDAHNVHKNPTEENKREFDVSNELVKGIASYIGTLATIGAGIVLYLNFRVAHRNAELTESRLITERFSKAVEQLGSDKIEVRLGGIYALERIAKDSERDHWTIMEVLTSFVREKSPLISNEQIRAKAYELWEAGDKTSLPEQDWHDAYQMLAAKPIAEDVQAALTVIGRRDVTKDPSDKGINLNQSNLTNADLIQANLSNAYLSQADLRNAHLMQSNLSNAYLSRANLSNASLFNADLRNSKLFNADLSYADLNSANLSNASLSQADLSNANLFNADLRNSKLFNADLSQANLDSAKLNNADLNKADLSNASLIEADLSNASLINTRFRNADLTSADFNGAKLFKTDFSKADLSFANLTEKQLQEAYLCQTISKDGDDVDYRDCERLKQPE